MVYVSENSMVRKYTAGTKADLGRPGPTLDRLPNRLYPLLGKGLTDLSTSQTIWGKIINIYQLYLPHTRQLLVGLKMEKSPKPLYSTIWAFQKSHQTRIKVGFQIISEEESQ